MKTIATPLILLIALLANLPCEAAELVLRERATQLGAVIRLGDIADISSATSAELKGLADTPLLPTPALGTRQFLNATQVRELLVARGILVDRLTFGGAKIVEIGEIVEIGTSSKPQTVRPNPMPPRQSQQEVEHRVQQAIERHLPSLSHNGRWRIEVLLDKGNVDDVAALQGALLVRGRPRPRSGNAQFFISDSKNTRGVAVTAEIAKIQSVVMVQHPIQAGRWHRSPASSAS